MRHIERLYKPEILIKKEKEWTEKFIQSGKARPSSKQYAHKDILDALMNISHGKCFYSEKKIEGLPKEVDHLVEVSIDKSKAFEWNNLYLSTKECNDGRPTENDLPKDDVLNPCLDSDEEIQKHLTFDNERATPKDNSEKGSKTIMKFKLNSELLLFQRMKHLQGICNFVLSLYKIRQKEFRSDFTEKEKAAIKAFANPDNAFSLMSEMYLRNQLPWLWT